MKRDMELIREILLQVEARTDLKAHSVEVEGVDPLVLARHVEMLLDAGMLEGWKSQAIGQTIPYVRVTDLSWEGHDFASALKNAGVWGQIKQKLSPAELATLPLTVLKDAGVALLGQYVKNKLGLH